MSELFDELVEGLTAYKEFAEGKRTLRNETLAAFPYDERVIITADLKKRKGRHKIEQVATPFPS
nr:hypothetical protein [uncultured Haemophilus sp.]